MQAGHIVAINSYSAVMRLALQVIDISAGDEIVATTLIFAASPAAVLQRPRVKRPLSISLAFKSVI